MAQRANRAHVANRKKKLDLHSILEFPEAPTQDVQICKRGAQPQTDLDETRLPSGECTPETPPRGPLHMIADTMAAFTDEPADTSAAVKAACMLSAAKVMATPQGTRFKRRSWAEMSEEIDNEMDDPIVVSWSTAPDMHSWASTPVLSPRAHGPGVAPVDPPESPAASSDLGTSDATVSALIRGLAPPESPAASSDLGTSDATVSALIRGLTAPESPAASSDLGSSDTTVSALIRGLREAAVLN